jgi:hypothetical protein
MRPANLPLFSSIAEAHKKVQQKYRDVGKKSRANAMFVV